MAEADNQEDGVKVGGKKKLIIIIAAVVLLLGGGAGAFFMFMGDDSAEDQSTEQSENDASQSTQQSGAANYVAMPRPFIFNVMDGKRDRLVQIKVQLMVRGDVNEALARKHTPLLEGTLVRVFGGASAAQLRSSEGKDSIRASALDSLNQATLKIEGKAIIESVLFTGFVLQ